MAPGMVQEVDFPAFGWGLSLRLGALGDLVQLAAISPPSGGGLSLRQFGDVASARGRQLISSLSDDDAAVGIDIA